MNIYISEAHKKRKELVADLRRMAEIVIESIDEDSMAHLEYYQTSDCINLLHEAAVQPEKAPISFPKGGDE